MELTTIDRLLLLDVLPRRGDITELRAVRALREELSFSDEEQEKLAFKNEGGGVISWTGDVVKDVTIGEDAKLLLKLTFADLNAKKAMTDVQLLVYEKLELE